MIVGGYSLHLYCDTEPHCPHKRPTGESLQGDFSGYNERDCMKQARQRGWTFKDSSTLAYCPACSKER